MNREQFTQCKKLLLLPFLLLQLTILAQEAAPGKLIICYGTGKNSTVHRVNADRSNFSAEISATKASNFQVTFSDFPLEAKDAFLFAVNIWQTVLHNAMPIRVDARWVLLEGNSLATTRPTKIYRGFEGAVRPDVWYPVSLAEKITNHELNETNESDIEISVNSNKNWYFGTDGNTPSGYVDLTSVILHEIAHGLGFSSSAAVTDSIGFLRDDNNMSIYDVILESGQRERLSTLADPSHQLQQALTSDDIFLFCPSAVTSKQKYPKVFAPAFFIDGSSISHLDEAEYPSGDVDALMSPYFALGESNHSLGYILPSFLNDIGWNDKPINQAQVNVFPNPGSGIFKLQIFIPITNSVADLIISDASGRQLKHDVISIQLPLNYIDLSNWADGIYIMTISYAQVKIVKKIVLLK